MIELDYSKISDIKMSNVHAWDAHDFTDAFVESATYDGREMTEAELDQLNEDSSFVHEQAMEWFTK